MTVGQSFIVFRHSKAEGSEKVILTLNKYLNFQKLIQKADWHSNIQTSQNWKLRRLKSNRTSEGQGVWKSSLVFLNSLTLYMTYSSKLCSKLCCILVLQGVSEWLKKVGHYCSGCISLRKLSDISFFHWQWDILIFNFQT